MTLLGLIPFNLLVAISIDKFIAVTRPLNYVCIVTKKTVVIMVGMCIIIPIIGLLPLQIQLLAQGDAHIDFYLPYGSCMMYFKETTHSPLSSILYMIFTAFQVLPLLLIIIFYSLIFHEVRCCTFCHGLFWAPFCSIVLIVKNFLSELPVVLLCTDKLKHVLLKQSNTNPSSGEETSPKRKDSSP